MNLFSIHESVAFHIIPILNIFPVFNKDLGAVPSFYYPYAYLYELLYIGFQTCAIVAVFLEILQ